MMRKFTEVAALVIAGWIAAMLIAPLGLASPPAPVPLGPTHGQACDDLNKLAYDPAVGQIVCGGGTWVRSVEPTGIRNMGTSCARSEMDSVMASSPTVT